MKQSGSGVHIPKDAPEMLIEFDFERGQLQTRHQRGYNTEITITNIKIYGDYVSEKLFEILIKYCDEDWTNEILASEGKRDE